MKKRYVLLPVLILVLAMLTGCCLSHEWQDATCEAAKTCAKCGETEGEALGHTWQDATCETAKSCSTCGKTEGEPLGHTWQDATCETPKTCTTCAATEGEALGHDLTLQSVTTTVITSNCSTCGQTLTEDAPADISTLAIQLLAGNWKAVESYDGRESTPLEDGPVFEFSADGTMVSYLEENPGAGTVVYDEYNDWFSWNEFEVTVNDSTYDVRLYNDAPFTMVWWYRDAYLAFTCTRQ